MFCWWQQQPKENTNMKIKKIQNFIYKKNDKIGQGHFSQVYEGLDEETGNTVAVKVIQINSIKSPTVLDMLKAEINIMKDLNHPNILRCLGSLNSSNNYYIITEYCQSGDLERYLKVHGTLDESEVQNIAYNIFLGLQYLSENTIVHRDLKIANIFLKEGVAKIGDFGFAVKSVATFRDISVGSPIYMSPQGLLRCEYGPKTDIWSFGVLIYELLHGQTPLTHCANQRQLQNQIMKPPKFNNNVSKEIKNFIMLCLDPNQKTRISIKQMKETSFMKKVASKVQGGKIRNGGINEALGTGRSTALLQGTFTKIKPQQAVPLLHYCRLIHKTTKLVPSMILSQWLLTLSTKLVEVTFDSSRQTAQKIIQVLNGYHKKYLKDHKVDIIQRKVEDAIKQCQSLIRSPYDKEFINFLLKESQILQQSLNQGNLIKFTKYSKSQDFLKKKDQGSNSNALKIKNGQTVKFK